MVRAWLSAVVLAALFLRDLRLLASAGPGRIVAACWAYPMFFGAYAAALALWLTGGPSRGPDRISLNQTAWVGILAVQVVLFALTLLTPRFGFANQAWLLALAPSPAALLGLYLLAGALPAEMANSLGIFSLFLFSVTWNALIVPFAFELVRGPFRDRFIATLPLRVVALLNLVCFFCLFNGRNFSPVVSSAFGGTLP